MTNYYNEFAFGYPFKPLKLAQSKPANAPIVAVNISRIPITDEVTRTDTAHALSQGLLLSQFLRVCVEHSWPWHKTNICIIQVPRSTIDALDQDESDAQTLNSVH